MINWDLYNRQDDFGQTYMLGVEQARRGLYDGLDRTINCLRQDLKDFPIFQDKICKYIVTLKRCKKVIRNVRS